ncbi:MAG: isopenicillin N synthase family oxygenase [Gammaproteobacteria bacterium]|nr:isopenicillin N synthase family oxygenase [Gammaproteobacteria bacterium]
MNNDSSNFKINPDESPSGEVEIEIKDIEPARAARQGEIPVIDISCLFANDKNEMRSIADQTRSACERIGFFYIVNHGVSQKIVDDVYEESRRFFNQSESFKQRLLFDDNDRGYKGPGNIVIPGYPPDLKEVLDLGVDLPVDHPDVVSGKPFHGPNQWPPLPGFREALMTYYREVSNVCHEMLRLFALALDLDEAFFQPLHDNAHITWRIMRYFPGDYAKGQYGTAPHTDFGTITLLSQDDLGGLEVYSRDREWIRAPHIPESFIVNIGDLMACWTNDRFTSTAHRVLNQSGQNRYSIPMFYNPEFDTVAECLPTCYDESNPPRYEPIHYGDYIKRIYSRVFFRG